MNTVELLAQVESFEALLNCGMEYPSRGAIEAQLRRLQQQLKLAQEQARKSEAVTWNALCGAEMELDELLDAAQVVDDMKAGAARVELSPEFQEALRKEGKALNERMSELEIEISTLRREHAVAWQQQVLLGMD